MIVSRSLHSPGQAAWNACVYGSGMEATRAALRHQGHEPWPPASIPCRSAWQGPPGTLQQRSGVHGGG